MNAVLAWPDPGTVSGAFARSVANLLLCEGQPVRSILRAETGPNLHWARNTMTEKFLESDHEWLLWIDSDMVFEPGAIAALFTTAKHYDKTVVGGLTLTSDRKHNIWGIQDDGHLHALVLPDDEPRMMQVDATGAACLLTHRSVYEDIKTEWWSPKMRGDVWLGEDMSFCARAYEAGHDVWVTTTAKFGHRKTEVLMP